MAFDGNVSRRNDGESKAKRIVEELGDHAVTLSHDRHITLERCKDLGLKVVSIEDDQDLQDRVYPFTMPASIRSLRLTPARSSRTRRVAPTSR